MPTTNANKQNRIELSDHFKQRCGLTAGVRTRKKGLNFPCDEWKFIRLWFRRSFVRCSLFFLSSSILLPLVGARKVIVIMKIMMLHPTTNAATVTSWTAHSRQTTQTRTPDYKQLIPLHNVLMRLPCLSLEILLCMMCALEDLWSFGQIDSPGDAARGHLIIIASSKKDKHFKPLIIPLWTKSHNL